MTGNRTEYDGPFCTFCCNEMIAVEAEGGRVSVDPRNTERVVRTYYGCIPCGKVAQEEDTDVSPLYW